jgi:hypothetical protein
MMIDTPTAFAIAVAMMALALTAFALAASLIHVRRRHRAMRATLNRVREERDEALRELAARGLLP